MMEVERATITLQGQPGDTLHFRYCVAGAGPRASGAAAGGEPAVVGFRR